jgi:hypothetical protein
MKNEFYVGRVNEMKSRKLANKKRPTFILPKGVTNPAQEFTKKKSSKNVAMALIEEKKMAFKKERMTPDKATGPVNNNQPDLSENNHNDSNNLNTSIDNILSNFFRKLKF